MTSTNPDSSSSPQRRLAGAPIQTRSERRCSAGFRPFFSSAISSGGTDATVGSWKKFNRRFAGAVNRRKVEVPPRFRREFRLDNSKPSILERGKQRLLELREESGRRFDIAPAI